MPLNLPPTLSLSLVGTIMVKLTSTTIHSIDIDLIVAFSLFGGSTHLLVILI